MTSKERFSKHHGPESLNILFGAFEYYKEKRIPWLEKVIFTILMLLYLFFPIDLIPDMLPVIGWLDDLGVGLFVLAYFTKRVRKVREKDKLEQK